MTASVWSRQLPLRPRGLQSHHGLASTPHLFEQNGTVDRVTPDRAPPRPRTSGIVKVERSEVQTLKGEEISKCWLDPDTDPFIT